MAGEKIKQWDVKPRERKAKEDSWKQKVTEAAPELEKILANLPQELLPYATGKEPIPEGLDGDLVRGSLSEHGFRTGILEYDGTDVDDKYSLPADFSRLKQRDYDERRKHLEDNPGKVNAGILQFLNALERVWFGEEDEVTGNRPAGLLAKYLVRKIRDEGFEIFRQATSVPDQSLFLNAFLALEDRGLIQDMNPLASSRRDVMGTEVKINTSLIEKHLEAFVTIERYRRLKKATDLAVRRKGERAEELQGELANMEASPEFQTANAEFGTMKTRTFVEMLSNRLWKNVSELPVEEHELAEEIAQMHARRKQERAQRAADVEVQPSEVEFAEVEGFDAARLDEIDRRIQRAEWALTIAHRTPGLAENKIDARTSLAIIGDDLSAAYKELNAIIESVPRAKRHPNIRRQWNSLENRARDSKARIPLVILDIGDLSQGLEIKSVEAMRRMSLRDAFLMLAQDARTGELAIETVDRMRESLLRSGILITASKPIQSHAEGPMAEEIEEAKRKDVQDVFVALAEEMRGRHLSKEERARVGVKISQARLSDDIPDETVQGVYDSFLNEGILTQ